MVALELTLVRRGKPLAESIDVRCYLCQQMHVELLNFNQQTENTATHLKTLSICAIEIY